MQIKAVLFDMFDTLIMIDKNYEFYNPAIARMHKFLSGKGINVSYEQFKEAYLKARDALYVKAEANLEEPHFKVRIHDALKLLGYNYAASSPQVEGATAEFCDEFMKHVFIDQHAKTVLNSLHGKYKLGIISNFAIPECIYKLLKINGLNELFDLVIISGEVNKRKPSPDIFKSVLKMLNISAEQAVFVGDTADADVAGANAVGMKAIYLKRRLEEGLQDVYPTLIIESLADLPSAIESM
jgi:HAD superfamily hydrolase (TIGR01509 family)